MTKRLRNNAEVDTNENQVSSSKYFITVIIWSMVQWLVLAASSRISYLRQVTESTVR